MAAPAHGDPPRPRAPRHRGVRGGATQAITAIEVIAIGDERIRRNLERLMEGRIDRVLRVVRTGAPQ